MGRRARAGANDLRLRLRRHTNARAINWGDEARTFMDEWSTLDIADPRWPGEERFVRAPDGNVLNIVEHHD